MEREDKKIRVKDRNEKMQGEKDIGRVGAPGTGRTEQVKGKAQTTQTGHTEQHRTRGELPMYHSHSWSYFS